MALQNPVEKLLLQHLFSQILNLTSASAPSFRFTKPQILQIKPFSGTDHCLSVRNLLNRGGKHVPAPKTCFVLSFPGLKLSPSEKLGWFSVTLSSHATVCCPAGQRLSYTPSRGKQPLQCPDGISKRRAPSQPRGWRGSGRAQPGCRRVSFPAAREMELRACLCPPLPPELTAGSPRLNILQLFKS